MSGAALMFAVLSEVSYSCRGVLWTRSMCTVGWVCGGAGLFKRCFNWQVDWFGCHYVCPGVFAYFALFRREVRVARFFVAS